jgi:hypothetical protein
MLVVITRMDKSNDKKSDWYFPPDLAVLLSPLFIALPCALISGLLRNLVGLGLMFCAAAALGVAGTILLFCARLPLYRQRRFLVFGPRELGDEHKRLYWRAYRFIGASVLLLIVLIVSAR